MNKKNKKGFKPKNSKLTTSPKLLKTLNKVERMGGSVSYITLTERIKFTKEHPNGEVYHTKSVLHSDVNPEVFFKFENNRRIRRTPQEILAVFESIKIDLGASYYILG